MKCTRCSKHQCARRCKVPSLRSACSTQVFYQMDPWLALVFMLDLLLVCSHNATPLIGLPLRPDQSSPDVDSPSSVTAPPLSLPLLCPCPSYVTAPPLSLPLLCHCPSSVTAPPLSLPLLCHCPSSVTAPPLSMPLLCHCPSSLTASPFSLPLLAHSPSSHTAPPLSLPLLSHCPSSLAAPAQPRQRDHIIENTSGGGVGGGRPSGRLPPRG
jgi:hypothetical protein